jgi:regulator of protease activity HflC (stomatin/prohibitin superfamily)
MTIFMYLAIAVFSLIFLLLSIIIVNQKQAKVIQRFGKYHSIRKAGISLRIPLVDLVAGTQNLQIQELRVPV